MFSNSKEEIQKAIGVINNNEIGNLVDYIEELVFKGEYVEEYIFGILEEKIANRIEDSRSFSEYKNLNNLLEKLNWIDFKNFILKCDYMEDRIIQSILVTNPELSSSLIELSDLGNERERRVIEYVRNIK
ncbi:hypothetical protein BJV85_001821 [Clostridium acetobutylicum]|uniref:Uncharacterized protein n=1 Tax=Clostridium acetobutylicum (strain ATCC 824 / DSM 792 / JCM 1419 / IAM 19013 / LMG 5710 / NBRC 13948 / NRRL B-527 / VKM B-1787 / 2291 / W) TaxID=272562 RepID=Q97HF5_CLOAB|nr:MULTISPECIES: hypothetical protein [Clostridium]AAK80015.1 Hypothetical protein CA_C2056 [Clostridium acetobutylicum ATCC 824]ADZ21107.1 Conserved hypothetical protein [Clostridium acetobutylicum EA 2018]AEI32162.1 hypothetical protein SMB_G2089 [Clostridium acetobutylicum DSM 1731]AWV79556.1 hypothetical protein DK921_05465 [Clostridium acetobutylicum]MBC2394470.1 hypothetical protein [Clostridium acetobutylicum]